MLPRRSKGFESRFSLPDERCLPDERALSVLGFPRGRLVCRHASSEVKTHQILSLRLSLTRPGHGDANFRQRLQQKSAAHWMALELSCTSRAPTSHDTCRCAGPWEHTRPAQQLSARRLSAMTPKAAKRTSKRRPARRKENQKPKFAAAKPPTKAKTKRRLQSLRRRAERQDRTPKLTRRDEHSSLAKSLGVRSLDLFRSFCPHESF